VTESTAMELEAIKSGHDRYDPMIERAFMKQVEVAMIMMGW